MNLALHGTGLISTKYDNRTPALHFYLINSFEIRRIIVVFIFKL